MLVSYAGKDPEDVPFSMKMTNWDLSRQSRAFQAYQKFRSGADTLDLAKKYGAKELTVVRWVNNERSKRLDLPNPKWVKP